jgi:hypothetical protein
MVISQRPTREGGAEIFWVHRGTLRVCARPVKNSLATVGAAPSADTECESRGVRLRRGAGRQPLPGQFGILPDINRYVRREYCRVGRFETAANASRASGSRLSPPTCATPPAGKPQAREVAQTHQIGVGGDRPVNSLLRVWITLPCRRPRTRACCSPVAQWQPAPLGQNNRCFGCQEQ